MCWDLDQHFGDIECKIREIESEVLFELVRTIRTATTDFSASEYFDGKNRKKRGANFDNDDDDDDDDELDDHLSRGAKSLAKRFVDLFISCCFTLSIFFHILSAL